MRTILIIGTSTLFHWTPLECNGQWQSVNGGVNRHVKTLVVDPDSSKLIVGGTFPYTRTDSIRVNNLAAWNGSSWSTEGLGNGNGDTSAVGSPDNQFVSLAYHHDTLFCGISGPSFQYHPEWDHGAGLYNNTWFPIGNPDGWLFLNEVNGRLFGGGQADTLYGQYMPGVREWVGGGWQPIPGAPWDETGATYSATYWHDQYWFAGSFISGGARSVIAFDGVDQWTPNWGPGGGWINAICGYGDSLYVGGWYPPGSDSESPMIQLWDGDQWQPFFNDLLEFHWQVFDIEVYHGALYVSGDFHFNDDPETQYSLLRFDGHEVCAIGGVDTVGVNGQIAFFQGDLYMALGSEFTGLAFEYIGRLPLDGLVPDRCEAVMTTEFDVAPSGAVRLSPNPTSEAVTISGLGDIRGGFVQVLDVLGQALTPAMGIRSSSMLVDASGWPSGTYQVRIVSDLGIRTRLFVKQ